MVRKAADSRPRSRNFSLRVGLLLCGKTANGRSCRDVLGAIGFDFSRGRLDSSTHPFTLIAGQNDVRLTIRVDEADPTLALLAVLHEGGHAIYDRGFAPADSNSLLGDSTGMADA